MRLQERDDLLVPVDVRPDGVVGVGVTELVPGLVDGVDRESAPLENRPLVEPPLAETLHLLLGVAVAVLRHGGQVGVLHRQAA